MRTLLMSLVVAAQEPPPEPADVGVLGAAEPLLVTDYSVDVLREGPAYQASAHVSLRNPRSSVVEGVALVPLPESAIARGFLAENGSVAMRGVVRSRDRAIDVYRGITRAVAVGRDPAILERLSDRWMRATIAPACAPPGVGSGRPPGSKARCCTPSATPSSPAWPARARAPSTS